MDNPVTGEPLSTEAAEYVEKLREVQRSARRDARSGNPAKRFPALAAVDAAPRLIRATLNGGGR